ncbi:hypothetical protein BJ170DRAFT_605273 [Xylariales sp. AK1849]|nr:hypothetical protein BJ170DRAFT_605273 [Xylariales sp. AK1849]
MFETTIAVLRKRAVSLGCTFAAHTTVYSLLSLLFLVLSCIDSVMTGYTKYCVGERTNLRSSQGVLSLASHLLADRLLSASELS